LGDAYVIPLLDTLDDIKLCVGAISVELPSNNDFPSERSNVPRVEDSTREVPFRNARSVETSSVSSTVVSQSATPPVPHKSRSEWFVKRWRPEFSIDRGFEDQRSWFEMNKYMGLEGSDIDIVLNSFGELIPYRIAPEVAAFGQDARLDDLESGKGLAGLRRAAWLDDRSCMFTDCSCARQYWNPLTATGLYTALRERV
jgi:hypothetical protein